MKTKPKTTIDVDIGGELESIEVIYIKTPSKIISLNHCRGGCDGWFEKTTITRDSRNKLKKTINTKHLCEGCNLRLHTKTYDLIVC